MKEEPPYKDLQGWVFLLILAALYALILWPHDSRANSSVDSTGVRRGLINPGDWSDGLEREGSIPSSTTNAGVPKELANPWWIIVSGRSWHEVDKAYEETNWGLGFEYKHNSRWSTVGGTYRNSFREQTYYLGEVYSPNFLQFHIREIHIKPGLLAGLLTGYANRVVVAVLPTLQVEISEKIGMDVLFGCKDLKCKEGVIGLSFKFNKGVLE